MKKRGNLPVTRPTFRGSGIALIVRTSNAEAHADMYINDKVGYYIPMSVIVALILDD